MSTRYASRTPASAGAESGFFARDVALLWMNWWIEWIACDRIDRASAPPGPRGKLRRMAPRPIPATVPSPGFPRTAALALRALGALLAAPLALGCSDVIGFSSFHSVCGPEPDPAPGGRVWVTRFGDAEFQEANGVAFDAKGNALVTGSFAGTLDAGGDLLESKDKKDAFVLKLDPAGNPLYSKSFGGRGYQYGVRVAADSSGNAVVAGRFNGVIDFCGNVLTSEDSKDTDGSTSNDEGKDDIDTDIFLAKLDPNGNCLWSAAFGGVSDQSASGLAVGADGLIYVTGSFKDSVDFGGNCKLIKSEADSDIFFAAFSPAGKCQWTRQQDFGGADTGRDIAVDSSGRAWAIGTCTQGNIAPCDTFGGLNVLLTRVDGGDLATWVFGGPKDQIGYGVGVVGESAVVMAGQAETSLDVGLTPALMADSGGDMFIASLDTDGNGQLDAGSGWADAFGDSGQQAATAITVSPSQLVAVAGAYDGTVDFGTNNPLPKVAAGSGTGARPSNAFVAAFNSNGQRLWSRAFGDGKSTTSAAAVAADADGNLIMAGSLGGSTTCGDDEGGGTLTTAGSSDVFLAKLRLK